MGNKYVENPTRSAPLRSLLVGIVFLTINHFLADKLPQPLTLLVVLGTLFVSIGIGGLIDLDSSRVL